MKNFCNDEKILYEPDQTIMELLKSAQAILKNGYSQQGKALASTITAFNRALLVEKEQILINKKDCQPKNKGVVYRVNFKERKKK